MIKHSYLNEVKSNNQEKAWYETIWGLVALTIGLNVLSNFIYEKSRDSWFGHTRRRDRNRDKQKDIDYLMKYEGQTKNQATSYVNEEELKLNKEEATGIFN